MKMETSEVMGNEFILSSYREKKTLLHTLLSKLKSISSVQVLIYGCVLGILRGLPVP